MENKKRIYYGVTITCVLISAAFFVLGCIAIWKNDDYAGGNHSFLFGTKTERFLMHYQSVIPIVASIPLFVPIFLRRNPLTIAFCLCGVALFVFLWGLVITLTD